MYKRTLSLFVCLLSTLPGSIHAGPVGQVFLKSSAGYVITIIETGVLKVNFPWDKTMASREHTCTPEEIEQLFSSAAAFNRHELNHSYIAFSGIFEFYGHKYRETISLMLAGMAVKDVVWGSSRKDVPATVLELSSLIKRLAEKTGKIPVHFIN